MTFGERFLAGRTGGAAPAPRWGHSVASLRLPGGGWLLDGLSAAQAAGVRERFGRFCTAAEAPVLRLRVGRSRAGAFRHWSEVVGEYTLDLRQRADVLDVAGIAFLARLRWRPREHGLLLTEEADGGGFAGILENLLRVGVAYRVAAAGGALLHGASLVLGAGVAVCIGHSGAGKSTLSRLALERGHGVLSDDLTVFGWDGDRPVVEPVPFCGDLRPRMPSPGRWPLRAVLHLRQAERPAARDLPAAEAVARMVGCAPTINHDPHRAGALVDAVHRLAERVPVGELAFRPDGSVWPVLERWLEERTDEP